MLKVKESPWTITIIWSMITIKLSGKYISKCLIEDESIIVCLSSLNLLNQCQKEQIFVALETNTPAGELLDL